MYIIIFSTNTKKTIQSYIKKYIKVNQNGIPKNDQCSRQEKRKKEQETENNNDSKLKLIYHKLP